MANLHVAVALAAALLAAGCISSNDYEEGPPPPTIPDDYVRGVDRYDRGMFQEAIDAFSSAIEERGDYAPAFTGRGNAYQHIIDTHQSRWREKQYLEAAVMDYSRAIELKPADPEPWYHRSVAFIGLRKFDLAVRDLLQLVNSVSPTDPDPHRLLGFIYEEKFEGMQTKAIEHYMLYIRKGGTDPQILQRMRGLESMTAAQPPPPVEGERDRKAKELFGEFGDAALVGDQARAAAALETLLNEYGDTEFVSSKREILQQMLEEARKQP